MFVPYVIGTLCLIAGVMGLQSALIEGVQIEKCPVEFYTALLGIVLLLIAAAIQAILEASSIKKE